MKRGCFKGFSCGCKVRSRAISRFSKNQWWVTIDVELWTKEDYEREGFKDFLLREGEEVIIGDRKEGRKGISISFFIILDQSYITYDQPDLYHFLWNCHPLMHSLNKEKQIKLHQGKQNEEIDIELLSLSHFLFKSEFINKYICN